MQRTQANIAIGALALLTFTGCDQPAQDPLIDLRIADPNPPSGPALVRNSEQMDTVRWVNNNAGVYTFHFNQQWPQALRDFCTKNPNLSVVDISPATENGAHSSIDKVIVVTREKTAATQIEIYSFEFNQNWPTEFREFITKNPEKMVTATFAGAQNGSFSGTSTMLVVTEVPN